MDLQYFLIGIVVVVSIVLFLKMNKKKHQAPEPDTDTRRPSDNMFPTNEVPNDKLVVIEDVNENDIKKILQEFCNAYNKDEFQAIPRLTRFAEDKFAITFPYDIDFEIYCYFINYVNYPMGFDRSFKTIGWATTKPSDNWTTEYSVNKHVMLYISDNDTEYDNVFLTTFDNIGYKLGFAVGQENQPLFDPEKSYEKPPVTLSELETKEFIDFK